MISIFEGVPQSKEHKKVAEAPADALSEKPVAAAQQWGLRLPTKI